MNNSYAEKKKTVANPRPYISFLLGWVVFRNKTHTIRLPRLHAPCLVTPYQTFDPVPTSCLLREEGSDPSSAETNHQLYTIARRDAEVESARQRVTKLNQCPWGPMCALDSPDAAPAGLGALEQPKARARRRPGCARWARWRRFAATVMPPNRPHPGKSSDFARRESLSKKYFCSRSHKTCYDG